MLFIHRDRLANAYEKAKIAGEDTELLTDEILLVDECISAPNRPIVSNYECKTPMESIKKTVPGLMNLKN